MNAWSDQELTTIGRAEELRVSSLRPDGTLRPYVTIWVVREGDDLYVRLCLRDAEPVVRACQVKSGWPDPGRRDRT